MLRILEKPEIEDGQFLQFLFQKLMVIDKFKLIHSHIITRPPRSNFGLGL